MLLTDRTLHDMFKAREAAMGWNPDAIIDAMVEELEPNGNDDTREALRARIRGVVQADIIGFGG